MTSSDDETEALIARIRLGDDQALGALFERYRPRLNRMVDARLDPRARTRVSTAERRFRASVAAAETLVARFPRLPQAEFDRILVELNLASFLHRTSRTDQARTIVEKCRTDFYTYNKRLVRTPISPFMASMIHERLAAAFAELGDESTGSNLRAEAESEIETWRSERRNRRFPDPIHNQ